MSQAITNRAFAALVGSSSFLLQATKHDAAKSIILTAKFTFFMFM
jgi:hypothetical protein